MIDDMMTMITYHRPIGKVNGEAQILTPYKIYTP